MNDDNEETTVAHTPGDHDAYHDLYVELATRIPGVLTWDIPPDWVRANFGPNADPDLVAEVIREEFGGG